MRDELRVTQDKAKRDLDFTIVRAPFDGVVGNRAAQLGALVAPGTRLMSLIPLDSVYVEANFKETDLAEMKVGQPAEVRFDAYPDVSLKASMPGSTPARGNSRG